MSDKAYLLKTYDYDNEVIIIAIFNGPPTMEKVLPVMEKFYTDRGFGSEKDRYLNPTIWKGKVRLRPVHEISELIVAGIDNQNGGVAPYVHIPTDSNLDYSLYMTEHPLL